jgi:hypothetical protein
MRMRQYQMWTRLTFSHGMASITRRSHRHFTNTMKQRITYVVKDPEEFSPEQLKVNQDSEGPVFTIQNVDAAKEHRITLGLDELPEEVYTSQHPFHISLVRLTFSSSTKSSNNGMNSTSAGPLRAPTQQHHPLHHVSRPVYTSSSHPWPSRPRRRYVKLCTLLCLRS